jgi:ArsR family transcriptional regulator
LKWPTCSEAWRTPAARIVHALVHEDMTTSGLAALLGMNQPAVSQHLRTLRMLRLINSRREGQFVLYSAADGHVRLLVNLTLTHLREGRSR